MPRSRIPIVPIVFGASEDRKAELRSMSPAFRQLQAQRRALDAIEAGEDAAGIANSWVRSDG